jgi:hypothetical protein
MGPPAGGGAPSASAGSSSGEPLRNAPPSADAVDYSGGGAIAPVPPSVGTTGDASGGVSPSPMTDPQHSEKSNIPPKTGPSKEEGGRYRDPATERRIHLGDPFTDAVTPDVVKEGIIDASTALGTGVAAGVQGVRDLMDKLPGGRSPAATPAPSPSPVPPPTPAPTGPSAEERAAEEEAERQAREQRHQQLIQSWGDEWRSGQQSKFIDKNGERPADPAAAKEWDHKRDREIIDYGRSKENPPAEIRMEDSVSDGSIRA